jgi:hypothetical protein
MTVDRRRDAARVFVDSRELALEEYGDAIAAGRIHAERQPASRIWWRSPPLL